MRINELEISIEKAENSVICSFIVPQTADNNLTGYFASYDHDGRLLSVQFINLSYGINQLTASIGDSYSAFVWNDYNEPITSPKSFQ